MGDSDRVHREARVEGRGPTRRIIDGVHEQAEQEASLRVRLNQRRRDMILEGLVILTVITLAFFGYEVGGLIVYVSWRTRLINP